jgi:nucleotide-binding universal stress UspA family protein
MSTPHQSPHQAPHQSPHQIRHILAPIEDATPDRVLDAATVIAHATGATVHVVHIDPDTAALDTDTDTETPGTASALVTTAVNTLHTRGITAEGAVIHGEDTDIPTLLQQHTHTLNADLVILGANHRTGLRALLEPSATDTITRHPTTWVLVIP